MNGDSSKVSWSAEEEEKRKNYYACLLDVIVGKDRPVNCFVRRQGGKEHWREPWREWRITEPSVRLSLYPFFYSSFNSALDIHVYISFPACKDPRSEAAQPNASLVISRPRTCLPFGTLCNRLRSFRYASVFFKRKRSNINNWQISKWSVSTDGYLKRLR